MSFIALLFSCGEQTIKEVPNSLPTVQIQSHGDNSEFDDGYEIQFYAQVSDQNHENEELQVSWYEGENLICDWETPDPSGVTRCNVIMTEGMERISVQVIDPDQGAGRDEIDVVVNPTDAPTATIFSPQVGGSYYSDQLVLFQGVIADTEDDPSYLTVEWSSSIDGILTLNTTPTSLGEIEDYATLTSGQHAIKLTVVDTTGKSTVESVVVDVAGPNNEPECEITLPQSGDAYIIGQNVEFQGVATDEDINNSLLNITWESDIDGPFNSFAPNSDGELTVVYNQLTSGNHIIKLSVEDEVGGLCTDTVQIAIGTAPSLSVTSPTDGTIFSVGDSVSFTATVSDQEDIASDISLLWTSDIDGELSAVSSDSSGNVSFNKSNLSAGLHSLSVVATDSTGLTASDSRSFRVNTPPNTPFISIIPTNPYTNEDLVVTVSATDDNGDSVTFDYTWLQVGNPTTYTGTGVTAIPSIPSSATSAGETWTLQVTPNDGYTTGTMAQQNVTIENSLPEITSVTIDTTNPYNNDVIQCSAIAEDLDETLVPEFTWTVNGSTYTGSSLDISTTTIMPADTITCTATVEDTFGETFELSDSVVVENRAPTVDSLTTTQSTIYTSSIVDCVATVSDLDGEIVEPVYSWTLEGQPFAGDESSVTLSPEQVGVGETLVCSASVTDALNESDSDEITWVIANTEPVIDSLILTPEEPFVDDELLCEVTVSDADNDDVTVTFEWENLTTGDTYPSTTTSDMNATLDTSIISVQSEDIIECAVSITDEFGGLDGDSLSVTMLNSGLVFTSEASISPNTGVKTGTEVTCSAEASDPNDGNLPVTYNWNVGGVAVGTPNSATYIVDAGETDVGSTIECVASVEDTEGETAESKATVTVENTEPTVDSVTLDQSIAYNDTTLTCSSTVSDPDETPNTTYTWQKNGTDLVMGQSIQLADYNINPEDEMTCVALVEDGSNAQSTGDVSISITNRDPQLSNILIDNTEPMVETTINCSVDVTDEDGESLQPSYEWTIGSDSVGNLPALTVDSSIAVDTEITCTATVEDGYGGTDTISTVAVVQNTDPTIGTVSINPSEITSESLLSCEATGTDINDGELQASYVWTNTTTGNQLGEEATVQLTTDNASPNDVIACVATVTDGNEGTASSQSTINVGNIPPVFDSEVSITPNTEVKTGTELLCVVTASDADDVTASLTYSWTVGSVEVSTVSTYTVSANDTNVGDSVMCTVTATDSATATATSTASVTIENTDPTVSGTIITGGMYNTHTLTCSATGSDPDESVGVDYTWTIDSLEIGTGSTIDLETTAALPEDEVVCTASVSDNDGGAVSDSATLTLVNRAPSTPVVAISPTTPTAGADDLVCNIITASSDADGQTVSYTYEWTKDSTSTSYTTNTIPAADVGASETWMCTVTPDDGMDFGSSANDLVTSASACVMTECDISLDLGGGQGIDFVNITAGTFVMGSPSNEVGRSSNEDRHSVTLTNDFLIATTEITQGMYYRLMGYQAYNGYSPTSYPYGHGNDYPAYYVSWNMAANFSNKLTQRHNTLNGTSLEYCYTCSGSGTSVTCSTAVQPVYSCTGYRLLTEAEWEYAARAGSTQAFWTSNGGGNLPSGYTPSTTTLTNGFNLTTYGWYSSTYNSPFGSKEVATLIPNDYGLYDMAGNLWEWTHDSHTSSLGTGTAINPVREMDSTRVFRGGGWNHDPEHLRSARRSPYAPTTRSRDIGFRPGRSNP